MEYEVLNSTNTVLTFSTRDNGNVGEEEYSEIDFKEGLRLKKLLTKEFENKIKINLEPVDEWVMLEITII
ncbi:MAG: hypothetical protein R6U15_01805 [Candidatus Izemoplasmatales bacterium]